MGAGLAANLLTSATALAILTLTGMPGIYLEKPIRLLIPPEVAGYVGLTVELGFTQSLLAWIFFVNLWAAVFNALPPAGHRRILHHGIHITAGYREKRGQAPLHTLHGHHPLNRRSAPSREGPNTV